LNPNYDVINDVISGFAKVVVERCGFHQWIAQRISWGEMVSIFLYLLQFPSYDVISDVIMSNADCTTSREPHNVAASSLMKITDNTDGIKNTYHNQKTIFSKIPN